MDFGIIMRLRTLWGQFTNRHPKFPSFMQTVVNKGVVEDCSIEITIDYPDGSHIKGGIVVNKEDLELFNELMNIGKGFKK